MKESNETLAFLQSMKEDDLTRTVLIPLFGRLGYVDPIFHGGTHEEGKDLIAFKHEPFNKLAVLVAQVKRFKSARSTAKSVEWGRIVHQLRGAWSKPVAYKDGQKHLPTEVAFITPYRVDIRLLEEQFEQVQLGKITIIDGAALYAEIQRTWPTLLADIGSVSAKIAAATKGALSNRELYESLKIADEVSFENTYSDLNFFVGRAETRELICSAIEFHDLPKDLTFNAWSGIKANLVEVEKLVGFDLISSQIPEIESSYAEANRSFHSEKNKQVAQDLGRVRQQVANIVITVSEKLESLQKDFALKLNSKEGSEEEIEAVPTKMGSFLRRVRDLVQAGEPLQASRAFDDKTLPSGGVRAAASLRTSLLQLAATHAEEQQLQTLFVSEPTISFSLNCAKVRAYVTTEVQWLRETVSKINSEGRGRVDIREFLRKIESLLSVVNRLVHTKSFGKEVFKLKRERDFENRFAISAHEVFDTGMNVAVYGEAGAGKSTTLHIYVKRKSERTRTSDTEALVFLPINRVMSSKSTSKFNEDRDLGRRQYVKALLKCALIYVGAEPSDQSVDDFQAWIKTRSRITFIIDGLDEAVTNNPWLLRAINGIPGAFSNAQVIISSRDCISEINDIDFLGITLLPFTEPQLKRFIEGWNAESGKALWASIKDQQLMDVAKNPLLATIVCSLHEHGIAIPANEPEVYRKYIALLCGQYDAFKQVKRTKSPQELLERVARVIAFKMHRLRLREIEALDLGSMLRKTFQETVSGEALGLATAELISPCAVLKRIPNTGRIGFGHLRFQEFLASEEFLHNNRYSPLDYVNDEWWKGVLYLYAFNVDMEELMAALYRTGRRFATSAANLRRMIEARPLGERSSLQAQLETWTLQEIRDDINPLDETESRSEWSEFRVARFDNEDAYENEFDFGEDVDGSDETPK